MALKKFARGDVILPAVVFLLTFAVALFKSGRPCITKTAPRLGCCFCYGYKSKSSAPKIHKSVQQWKKPGGFNEPSSFFLAE